MEVYDGPTLLARLCGHELPSPASLTASSGEMLVQFHSDDTTNYAGFQAEY